MYLNEEQLELSNEERLNGLVKELNMEVMDIRKSPEYKLGRNILLLKKSIKALNFTPIIDLIKLRYKLKCAEEYNKPTKISTNICGEKSEVKFNKKIAIYTCIFGNYDKIYEPKSVPNNCDFYIVTDQNIPENSLFNTVNINQDYISEMNNVMKNRFFKMNPHLIFPEYEYSIYIDGNIEIYSDLSELINKIHKTGVAFHAHSKRNCIYNEFEVCKILKKGNANMIEKQIKLYNQEGFPHDFGMVEANVIARQHNNLICKNLMNSWWKEYELWGERDQISLPYVLWKHKMKISDVATLGEDVHMNSSLRIHSHT